ncbi:MAG: hypothetical protein GY820_43440 [Gammaproteobacteria bacterium]|nr:hypothetical protein [Gammaproteobacteria bacterium]
MENDSNKQAAFNVRADFHPYINQQYFQFYSKQKELLLPHEFDAKTNYGGSNRQTVKHRFGAALQANRLTNKTNRQLLGCGLISHHALTYRIPWLRRKNI